MNTTWNTLSTVKTVVSKYQVVFHKSFLGRKLKKTFLKSERLKVTSKLNLSTHLKTVNTTVLLFKNQIQRNYSRQGPSGLGPMSQDKTFIQKSLYTKTSASGVFFFFSPQKSSLLVFRVVEMSTFLFLNAHSGRQSKIYST